ncbi:MAG: hypothetical protein D6713_07820 [Deltaproteobacteria bacterium]|nr:MAG: hypothetical protein D6713_07820 [Deltaproteobacteria bacterium]
MGIQDIFWLFLMFFALQPLFRKSMLESARKKLLEKIEKERGSRVILLIHRMETMSLFGFPVFRYIDVHDAEEVIRAVHLTSPDTPIDLILHTPGGLALASFQIARALARHKGKVTVFVPHYAMSGGTIIALAADEIVMCEHSVLGPVDPQLGNMPAASILKVVKTKPVEEIDDQTLILADQAEKAIRQVKDSLKEILLKHYPEEKAEEISTILSEGRWTHDYAITFEEAQRLGLRVSTEMPESVLNLMELYPQPVKHVPSVEYIPVPRRDGRSGTGKAQSR